MSGRPKPGEIPTKDPMFQGGVLAPNWIGFFLDVISRKPQHDEYHSPDTGVFYFGDESTDGSWRVIREGNNLVHQRLESGTWTTKHTITP